MTEMIGKRELNKARKRAEIVRIATLLFLEHGYAATTMSAIADTLGGSKATLWAHFSSKEELFSAVIDMHIAMFSRDIEEVLTGQTFSPAALRRACIRFLDCLLNVNSALLYRLVVSEGGRFPEIKEMFYERGPVKMRAAFTGFFSTRFEADEAARLTQFIVSTVSGYRTDLLLRPTKATKAQHEAFIDNLIAHIAFPPEKEAPAD
ncbi:MULTISPECIES: TetR/AcrR family transcriptional regulator [unclassified Novosphingobium]|uniref:TetR/AcrR family transcriptional regulator n=1 Tax=unclassified Novosphingobium TaxID=2644732 RepID=UPI00190F6F20|nr:MULTISPECIES: TetR/AcrR family transcriptional regulator [unclassified Novosphingobium]